MWIFLPTQGHELGFLVHLYLRRSPHMSCVIFHFPSLSVFPPLSRAYLCSSPSLIFFFHTRHPSLPCSQLISPLHAFSLPLLPPPPCFFPPAPHWFNLYLSPVISPAVCCVVPDQLTCSRGLLHLDPPSLLSVWHITQNETGQRPFIINFKKFVVLGAILTVYMSYWMSSNVYGDIVWCCTVKFASLLSQREWNHHSNVASCCVCVSWIDSVSLWP